MTAAFGARCLVPLALSLSIAPLAAEGVDGDRVREGSSERIDVTVPGRVQSAIVHRSAIWLLVSRPLAAPPAVARPAAPADPCRRAGDGDALEGSLWRLEVGAERPRLLRVRAGLPSRPGALLSMDVDGDGVVELLGLFRDALFRIPDDDAPLEPLYEDPDLHPYTSTLVASDGQAPPLLALPGMGRARFLTPVEESWQSIAEAKLPVEAVYRRNEFRLDTRPPRPVRVDDRVVAFSTRPEAMGKQRLRGTLVRPLQPDDRQVEWWAGLPEPEELMEHAFLDIAGKPALLVTTRPAYKLSFFGEKRIRLYRLAADRSRTGHAPFFATKSRANLWQSIVPYVLDADGDGRRDLVLAYWKGLKDARIVLDAYLADGGGSFDESPRTTGFNVKKGERSYVAFGRDVTGDSWPDLLVIGDGRLQVYAGNPSSRKGRELVTDEPRYSILLVEDAEGDDEVEVEVDLNREGMQLEGEVLSSRGPRLVDLDGDGRHEVLLVKRETAGWKVSLVRFGLPPR